MKLRIKSSYKDMEIEIPNRGCPRTTSVAQLKALVRTALLQKEAEKEQGNGDLNKQQQHNNNNNSNGEQQDRYLRLICKGRLLSPDESSLSEFKVVDNDVIHAVLAAAGGRRGGGSTFFMTAAFAFVLQSPQLLLFFALQNYVSSYFC